eukprot:COSAG01_NODE_489_length_16370_cov_7.973818_4_plen_71_part_00
MSRRFLPRNSEGGHGRAGAYPSGGGCTPSQNQFIWHTDRGGHTQREMPQVYFRNVLDPQRGAEGAGRNAR